MLNKCQITSLCNHSKYDVLWPAMLLTWCAEFRRYRNANTGNSIYSQQQTIFVVETFFHSNLLQSSLTSLSVVRSPPKTLHTAETRILWSVHITTCTSTSWYYMEDFYPFAYSGQSLKWNINSPFSTPGTKNLFCRDL